MSLPLDATDHTKGSKTPKVTFVEYSDFQCPACATYNPILEEVFAEYKDRISFTYRNFPLPQHQNGMIAAYAAEAAALQGKFWEMGDALFKNQDTWSLMDNETALTTFDIYAQKAGLDVIKFKADETSDVVKAKVDRDQKSGFASSVDHTPSFFINGKIVTNPGSAAELKTLINNAIKNS
jgi:protein-disulfide isomerase